jgi:hypothetical protein
MRISFQKDHYGLESDINIKTSWMIQSVKFKSGCYRAAALNEEEFKSLIRYLVKNFSSIEICPLVDTISYSHNTANFFRFIFKDEADEAYFKMLSFDGIER